MPPKLSIEMLSPGSEDWTALPAVTLGDPDGSVSDNHEQGRDVYLFGVDPIENQGYIKKSTMGADLASDAERVISTAGFVTVAALGDGESHELMIRTDKSTEPRILRFTYSED